MDDRVVIRTRLENPPEELVYPWREPYERFPVRENGVVEGLSVNHPRFVILKFEWKLEVETVEVEEEPRGKPERKPKKKPQPVKEIQPIEEIKEDPPLPPPAEVVEKDDEEVQ